MLAEPKFESRLFVNRLGGLVYVQRIAFETQQLDYSRNLAVLYGPENPQWGSMYPISRESQFPLAAMSHVRDLVLSHLQQRYRPFTPRLGREAEFQVLVGNERVMRTLAAATDVQSKESPQEWWDWWSG